jgi:hypothetical protein
MTIATDITEADTMTNSLPIRMVTMSWRGLERSSSIRVVRGLRARRICSNSRGFRENSEVSEVEKKADKPIKPVKMTSSKTISMFRDVQLLGGFGRLG